MAAQLPAPLPSPPLPSQGMEGYADLKAALAYKRTTQRRKGAGYMGEGEEESPLTKQLSMEQETRPGRVIIASREDSGARGA